MKENTNSIIETILKNYFNLQLKTIEIKKVYDKIIFKQVLVVECEMNGNIVKDDEILKIGSEFYAQIKKSHKNENSFVFDYDQYVELHRPFPVISNPSVISIATNTNEKNIAIPLSKSSSTTKSKTISEVKDNHDYNGNDFNSIKSDSKKDYEEESGDFNDSEKEEKSLETIITKESEKPAKRMKSIELIETEDKKNVNKKHENEESEKEENEKVVEDESSEDEVKEIKQTTKRKSPKQPKEIKEEKQTKTSNQRKESKERKQTYKLENEISNFSNEILIFHHSQDYFST